MNIYTGFTPSQLMTNTGGCCYSLWCSWWWTQRVFETCRAYLQFLINTILPELHLVDLLYIIDYRTLMKPIQTKEKHY